MDAALFDLGVSSLQLDEADRGFAYRLDAPLDMRMDQADGLTAAEVLNTYDADDLTRILRDYGEERFARRIAARRRPRARHASRSPPPAGSSSCSASVVPAASQRSGGHPAKRTFQALRIEVNAELAAWERALPAAIDALAVGGRIAVLSLPLAGGPDHQARARRRAHVQHPARACRSSCPSTRPYLRLLTRGAEEPSPAEVAANPRAASARLRAAERVRRTSTARAVPPGRRGDIGDEPEPADHGGGARARRQPPHGVCRGPPRSPHCGWCPPRSGVPATGCSPSSV